MSSKISELIPDHPLAYDISTVQKLLGISRGHAYSLARQGVLPTLRLGKRVLVPAKAIERLIESALQPGAGMEHDRG